MDGNRILVMSLMLALVITAFLVALTVGVRGKYETRRSIRIRAGEDRTHS